MKCSGSTRQRHRLTSRSIAARTLAFPLWRKACLREERHCFRTRNPAFPCGLTCGCPPPSPHTHPPRPGTCTQQAAAVSQQLRRQWKNEATTMSHSRMQGNAQGNSVACRACSCCRRHASAVVCVCVFWEGGEGCCECIPYRACGCSAHGAPGLQRGLFHIQRASGRPVSPRGKGTV